MLKQRNLQRQHGLKRGIVELGSAGGTEESECCVVAEAVIYGEARCYAPGILRVESQPLHVLREAAIAGRRTGTGCPVGDRKSSGGRARQVHHKLLRISEIERGILGEYGQVFRVAGKRAAQDGFMDESTPKLGEWRPDVWLTL